MKTKPQHSDKCKSANSFAVQGGCICEKPQPSEQSKHSPLPWKANSQGVWAKDAIYHSKDDTHEAVLWEAQEPYANKNADAAFIVQSVNRALIFDELLQFVKMFGNHRHFTESPDQCAHCKLIARAEAVQEGK